MKKFKVFATSVTHYSIEVEAENKDEAHKIAQDADGGDFVEVALGDWNIEYNTIEELE